MLEEITNNDSLYRRLSRISHINPKTGKVTSAAFKRNRNPDNSISVDLARSTTPQETLDRERYWLHFLEDDWLRCQDP